jgi:predicted DNA-binding transcriptional regulator YafY
MNNQLIKFKKLLNLIPLLHQNPGIEISALCRLAQFASKREAVHYLNQLIMLGKPPFSPGDYIDIFIDTDGRIFLETAQGMEKPLSLNPDEWNTLFQVIDTCSRFGIVSVDEIENIYNIMGKLTSIQVKSEIHSSQIKKRIIEEASEEQLQLQFSYHSLHSKESELRRVDPYAVFTNKGNSYLAAYCHLRNNIRYFHLDRMDNPEILDMPFSSQVPENLIAVFKESPIFQTKSEGYTVSIGFHKTLFTSLHYRLNLTDIKPIPESEHPFQEGWYIASAKIQDILWFKMTVKSLGQNIFIHSPDHLKQAVRNDIDKSHIPEPICE